MARRRIRSRPSRFLTIFAKESFVEQESNSFGPDDHSAGMVFTLTTLEEKYQALLLNYYALALEHQALLREKLTRRATALDFNLYTAPSDCVNHPWNYKRDYNDFGLKKACFPPPDSHYPRTLLFENLGSHLISLSFDRDWMAPYIKRPRFTTEEKRNLLEPPFLKKKSLLEYVSLQHRVVMSERVYKENKFFPEERFIMRRKSGRSYNGTTRRLSFINLAAALTWFVADAGTIYSVRVRELPIASPIRPTTKHSLRDLRVRRGNCRRKSGIRGK